MPVKPILFNTDMVKAILDGRKNVTRRVIKPQPTYEDAFWKLGGAGWSDNINSFHPVPGHSLYNRMPYKPEDILYVRETVWQRIGHYLDVDGETKTVFDNEFRYPATDIEPEVGNTYSWVKRPSIHMPKEAARIWLKVTDVRVERLRDITEEQAKAEGANYKNGRNVGIEEKMNMTAVERFAEIWDSTIKKSDLGIYGWEANPWVWVVGFERCDKPN
jgi:hypothetical protein